MDYDIHPIFILNYFFLSDQPTVPIPIPLSQSKPTVPVNMNKRIPKKTMKSSESAAQAENLKKVKKTITKRKTTKSITMKNSSSKQRKNLLQKTSSKELLKSTLCLENANGWHKLGLKPPGGHLVKPNSLNNPIPVFKASELDRNPIWQSCKLKIKIPLMKMNSEDLPTPQYRYANLIRFCFFPVLIM